MGCFLMSSKEAMHCFLRDRKTSPKYHWKFKDDHQSMLSKASTSSPVALTIFVFNFCYLNGPITFCSPNLAQMAQTRLDCLLPAMLSWICAQPAGMSRKLLRQEQSHTAPLHHPACTHFFWVRTSTRYPANFVFLLLPAGAVSLV